MTANGLLIVFVCTSNTCRSPMAEQFAKKYLSEHSLDQVKVVSRSLTTDYEPEGSPASEQGVLLLREQYGIDMTAHRSKMLTDEDVAHATVIVGVSGNHSRVVQQYFPLASGKTTRLDQDISDPWHQSIAVYKRCAEQMQPLVNSMMERWCKEQNLL